MTTDFTSIKTTDDLLLILPPDENDRWEFKAGSILADRGKLSSELGKQVSAFANSGGGNLVLGIADKTRAIAPCSQLVGRQSMKDWLSTMVESSVEYPIRHYRIHEIPCSSDPTKSVFVVAVDDSPAAPHQAKVDRIYYYRIDGHTKAAPHFHVELLRNRMTKAVLEIESIDHEFTTMQNVYENKRPVLIFTLIVAVKNCSFQAATEWGIIIKNTKPDERWETGDRFKLDRSICLHDTNNRTLLPSESTTLRVQLKGFVREDVGVNSQHPSDLVRELWRNFGVTVMAVTQNSVGEEKSYGDWREEIKWLPVRSRFSKEGGHLF